MDPNATLELLVDAALSGDAEAVREHAANLADWLDKGGFKPGLHELRVHVSWLEQQ